MKSLSLILLVTLVTFCFGIQKDDKILKLDILAETKYELKNLSEVSSDIQYIPLQTTDNSLMGVVRRIRVTDKNLYISTVDQVFCFNKDGQYLNKLNKRGRGPGEYSNLFDFDISYDDNYIVIISLQCLMIYKKSGNEYAFFKKVNYFPDKANFIPDQNYILLSYSTADGQVPFHQILINMNGDTLNYKPNYFRLKQSGPTIGLLFENVSYIFKNAVYFKELLNDTIFRIDENQQIDPYLILDSGGKKPSAEDRANGIVFNQRMAEYLIFTHIMEVSHYLFFSYTYNKEVKYIMYDKTDKRKYAINNKTFLYDDIAGGINFKPTFCDNNKFYSLTDALTVKKHVSSETYNNSKPIDPKSKIALKKVADSIKETDNQVLIVATAK